jgi:hypothetical protein
MRLSINHPSLYGQFLDQRLDYIRLVDLLSNLIDVGAESVRAGAFDFHIKTYVAQETNFGWGLEAWLAMGHSAVAKSASRDCVVPTGDKTTSNGLDKEVLGGAYVQRPDGAACWNDLRGLSLPNDLQFSVHETFNVKPVDNWGRIGATGGVDLGAFTALKYEMNRH